MPIWFNNARPFRRRFLEELANNKPTKKIESVKRNKTSCASGKALVSDKRYIKRNGAGQFVEKPNTARDTKSKGDKMFERVWKDIHDRRDRRVG